MALLSMGQRQAWWKLVRKVLTLYLSASLATHREGDATGEVAAERGAEAVEEGGRKIL